MASSPISIQRSVNEEEPEWVETLSALIDPFFLADRRNMCAEQYARGLEAGSGCAFHITNVLRRADAVFGFVVYSRSSEASESELRSLGLEPPGVLCEACVKCLAATRLDVKVPLPPGDWDEVAVSQSFFGTWGQAVEPANMIKYSEALARQANRAGADAVLPSEHVKAAQLRRQAEYYRFKAQNSAGSE